MFLLSPFQVFLLGKTGCCSNSSGGRGRKLGPSLTALPLRLPPVPYTAGVCCALPTRLLESPSPPPPLPSLTWVSRPSSGSFLLPSWPPFHSCVRAAVASQPFVLAGVGSCLQPLLPHQLTPRTLRVEGTWVSVSDPIANSSSATGQVTSPL